VMNTARLIQRFNSLMRTVLPPGPQKSRRPPRHPPVDLDALPGQRRGHGRSGEIPTAVAADLGHAPPHLGVSVNQATKSPTPRMKITAMPPTSSRSSTVVALTSALRDFTGNFSGPVETTPEPRSVHASSRLLRFPRAHPARLPRLARAGRTGVAALDTHPSGCRARACLRRPQRMHS